MADSAAAAGNDGGSGAQPKSAAVRRSERRRARLQANKDNRILFVRGQSSKLLGAPRSAALGRSVSSPGGPSRAPQPRAAAPAQAGVTTTTTTTASDAGSTGLRARGTASGARAAPSAPSEAGDSSSGAQPSGAQGRAGSGPPSLHPALARAQTAPARRPVVPGAHSRPLQEVNERKAQAKTLVSVQAWAETLHTAALVLLAAYVGIYASFCYAHDDTPSPECAYTATRAPLGLLAVAALRFAFHAAVVLFARVKLPRVAAPLRLMTYSVSLPSGRVTVATWLGIARLLWGVVGTARRDLAVCTVASASAAGVAFVVGWPAPAV